MAHHEVYVIEQADDKPFNRGKLINVGFLEIKPDYFVAHDVDMIPVRVDYSPSTGINQLAVSTIQLWDYLGGVTMYNAETFKLLGGYHNDYFHRAEDNEMMFNIKRLNFKVWNKTGHFVNLPHERTGPEFIPELWEKAKHPRLIQDQLSICKYELVSREEHPLYTDIKVKL